MGRFEAEGEGTTIQLGLSPRHCQADNGLISLLFTPV